MLFLLITAHWKVLKSHFTDKWDSRRLSILPKVAPFAYDSGRAGIWIRIVWLRSLREPKDATHSSHVQSPGKLTLEGPRVPGEYCLCGRCRREGPSVGESWFKSHWLGSPIIETMVYSGAVGGGGVGQRGPQFWGPCAGSLTTDDLHPSIASNLC